MPTDPTTRRHKGPACSENGILGFINEEIAAMANPTPRPRLKRYLRTNLGMMAEEDMPFAVNDHPFCLSSDVAALEAERDAALERVGELGGMGVVQVLAEELPLLLELSAKATTAPWNNDGSDGDPFDKTGIAWEYGLLGETYNQDPNSDQKAQHDCDFIVAARNAIHRIALAKKGGPNA